MLSLICKKIFKHKTFFSINHLEELEYPEGGGYLAQFLLGMCRWPLRTPTPECILVANYRPHLSHF